MRSSGGQTEDNGMAHPPADDGSHLPPIEVTRLIVEIEPGADPVQGRIGMVGGPSEAFSGWTDLASAIERYRTSGSGRDRARGEGRYPVP